MRAVWLTWLLALGPAGAGEDELLPDVRRPLGQGAAVNWTHHRLELVVGAEDPSLTDTRPLEQEANDGIDAGIGPVLARVPVTVASTVGDVAPEEPHRAADAWRIRQTRYYASGRVEVMGAVDLVTSLAAWSAGRAVLPPPPSETIATGLVVDARGLPVTPTWAPTIRDAEGSLLYEGLLWKDVAWDRAPAVWVSDPAHPAASAAGGQPLLIRAAGWAEGAIVLSTADAARVREQLEGRRPWGEGAVVLVVDP